jgi:hypothetical protein
LSLISTFRSSEPSSRLIEIAAKKSIAWETPS